MPFISRAPSQPDRSPHHGQAYTMSAAHRRNPLTGILLVVLATVCLPALAYTEAEIDQRFKALSDENAALREELEQLKKNTAQDRLQQQVVEQSNERQQLRVLNNTVSEQRRGIKIKGFFTLGASNASPVTVAAPELEFRNKTSFEPDSILGLQTSFIVSDKTDVTAQFVARGADDWNLETDWAFMRYQPSEKLSLRGGRLRLPLYLFSESLEVGFSYPWVRPPVEVYQVPISTYEGMDVTYSQPVGDWVHKTQFFIGSDKGDNFETNTFFGGNITSLYDAWTFRLSVYKYDLTVNESEVIPQTPFTDKSNRYYTVATMYDDGNWLFIGEYFYYDANDKSQFFRDTDAGYITAGYRFGNWLPHVTYAKTYSKNEPELPSGVFVRDPSSFQGQSWTIGNRFDITPNTSLKLEWTRYSDLKGSASIWNFLRFDCDLTSTPFACAANDIDRIDIYTITLDAVF